MAGGRPTDYNKEIADYICEIVATNHHGLGKLCKMFDKMPDRDTINLWRFKHKEFSAQYLTAKTAQMDLVMEELDDIMDENLHYYEDDKGRSRIDAPSASIAIAKANNRKWFASKIAPKLYGDRSSEDTNSNTSQQEVQDKMNSLSPLPSPHEKEF